MRQKSRVKRKIQLFYQTRGNTPKNRAKFADYSDCTVWEDFNDTKDIEHAFQIIPN